MNETLTFSKTLTFEELPYGEQFLWNDEIYIKTLDHEPKAFSLGSKKFVSIEKHIVVAVLDKELLQKAATIANDLRKYW